MLEDGAVVPGASLQKLGALKVGALLPGGRGNLGRVCGRRVGKGRVALPQGAPTGRPRDAALRRGPGPGAEASGGQAAGPGRAAAQTLPGLGCSQGLVEPRSPSSARA